MVEITQKLATPKVPNYIMIESKPSPHQDGMVGSPKVSIADLSDKQLRDIAEEWKDALLSRAHQIRTDRRAGDFNDLR